MVLLFTHRIEALIGLRQLQACTSGDAAAACEVCVYVCVYACAVQSCAYPNLVIKIINGDTELVVPS